MDKPCPYNSISEIEIATLAVLVSSLGCPFFMSTEHGIGSVLSVGVQVRVVFARESSAYAVQCHWVAFAIGPMAFSETPSLSGLTHCSHILRSVTGLQIFENVLKPQNYCVLLVGVKEAATAYSCELDEKS